MGKDKFSAFFLIHEQTAIATFRIQLFVDIVRKEKHWFYALHVICTPLNIVFATRERVYIHSTSLWLVVLTMQHKTILNDFFYFNSCIKIVLVYAFGTKMAARQPLDRIYPIIVIRMQSAENNTCPNFYKYRALVVLPLRQHSKRWIEHFGALKTTYYNSFQLA